MLVQIETKTRNCLISRYDVQLALSKIDPYLANLGNELKLIDYIGMFCDELVSIFHVRKIKIC